MGNQFSVQLDVILAERHSESWDVERDVEDAEEDKAGGKEVQTASAADDLSDSGTGRGYLRKLCRKGLPERSPVHHPEVVAGVEAVPGFFLGSDVKDPPTCSERVHRDASAEDDDVEDDRDDEKVGRENELVRVFEGDKSEEDGEEERDRPEQGIVPAAEHC